MTLRSDSPTQAQASAKTGISRRQWLRGAGLGLAALALGGCRERYADIQTPRSSALDLDTKTLHLYTWAGYIDAPLIEAFEEATGIRVVVDLFDSNETMLTKLILGSAPYSLVYPSDYMVQQMTAMGLLAELEGDRIPALADLHPRFTQLPHDPGNHYSVPLSWGTTGLLYNTQALGSPLADWVDLWEQRDQLIHRLDLFNDVREVMGAALRASGYSYNSTDNAQLQQAYNQLATLKPAISSFTTDAWRMPLVVGDLAASMAYSADAIALIRQNPTLAYCLPASGSSLWIDTMAIPKQAPNPDAAYAWINFMLSVEPLVGVAQRLFLAPTTRGAIAHLPPDLRDSPILMPSEAALAPCEQIAPLDEATLERYNDYWTQLTSL